MKKMSLQMRVWDINAKKMCEVKYIRWLANGNIASIGCGDETGFQTRLRPRDCELMRPTGLKDKKGVKIYEGDIIEVQWVEDETFDRGEVQWVDAGFGFVMEGEGFIHQPRHLKEKSVADIWDDPSVLIIEVIGNIYQHSELLK